MSQVFSVFCIKMLKLYEFWRKSQVFGVFVGISSVISVLVSKYPNYSDFSAPITDYNSQIIRFYQFFGVIDN